MSGAEVVNALVRALYLTMLLSLPAIVVAAVVGTLFSLLLRFNTAQGGRVQLSTTGTTLKVNNATVVKADVPASNGVIHVIDTVLLPK